MTPLVEARLYRDAANVNRYHTQRTLRTQDLGQHTFNMLMLIQQVAPDCRKEVLVATMHHDLPELFTGDMRGDFKKMVPEVGLLLDEAERDLAPLYRDVGLTPDEEALVKWADRMELVLWALEEARMGNTYMRDVAENGISWVLSAAKDGNVVPNCPAATQLTAELMVEMTNQGYTVSVVPVYERN